MKNFTEHLILTLPSVQSILEPGYDAKTCFVTTLLTEGIIKGRLKEQRLCTKSAILDSELK